jgi:beta-glucanase (GH16 family)
MLMALIPFVSRAAEASTNGYRLVWADEFDKDGTPNPKNWTFEQGFVRNNELQWYQPENATCKNGLLVIEYTSACLTTLGLHSWQYGRFEVKARIKTQEGLWPAIWFLGIQGEWPSNGEIDLLEYYGGNILANACWGTKERWKAKWNTSKKPMGSFGDPKWDEKFHVWRMDWDTLSG